MPNETKVNVQFKRGLLASLPTTAADGTIYITTDEGGIYLGVGTTMKRLGDYITVASISALPAANSVNTNALYYATSENVLARSNGTKWIQINAAGLTNITVSGNGNAITAAEVNVDSATGAKKLNLTKGKTFVEQSTYDDLATQVSSNESAITQLQTNLTAITGDDGSIASAINALRTELKGTGTVDTNYDTIAELATKLQAAEGTISIHGTNITAAQTDINNINGKIGTVATGKTVVDMISDAQTTAAQSGTDAAAAEQTRAQAVEKAITDSIGTVPSDKTVVGMISTAQTGVNDLTTRVGSLETAKTADEAYLDKLMGTDKATSSANQKSIRTIANEELAAQLIPSTATEALNTLQEIAAWIQAHPGEASAMNAAITELETRATNIETKNTSQDTAISNAEQAGINASAKVDTEISNLKGDVSTDYNTLKKLEDKVKEVQSAAEDAVSTNTSQGTSIINLTTRVTTVEGLLVWGSF